MDQRSINITVLGAGVIGLTNALLLSRNPRYRVTVIAKHMPGDYDIEYASPWAGANYLPFSAKGSRESEYEASGWAELQRLARDVPEAGIHFQTVLLYDKTKSDNDYKALTAHLMAEDPWYKGVVPDWRRLEPHELPKGTRGGATFGSVCINVNIYLPWLLSQCVRNGVTFHRGVVKHVTQPAKTPDTSVFTQAYAPPPAADVVINCTGLASRFLKGVQDEKLYPLRGQIVVVENSAAGKMYTVAGDAPHHEDEFTYAMERALGGGTVLGGCAQKDRWDSQPDPSLALRIMKRCIDACPALVEKQGGGVEGLAVLRHSVGLRPAREGGIRVDKEQIDGVWVVHCYGHGGYGYQTSYGTCNKTVQFVDDIVGQHYA